MCTSHKRQLFYFNSRPSARGDFAKRGTKRSEVFQFTPLREGRRYPIKPPASDSLFQFTPLREGRLQVLAANNVIVPISIHAPPRGATATLREASLPTSFQFTPLREGRRNQRQDGGALEYFNSRPSARGDEISDKMGALWNISIHAPPRGATEIFLKVVIPLPSISIHAPPRGATIATADIIAA